MRFLHLFIVISVLWTISDPALAKHHKKTTHHQRATTSQPAIRISSGAINGTNQLINELNYIIHSSDPRAEIAVFVRSMQYRDSLYSRNIHTAMTPASTMKILTAESALIFLGSDYRFSTRLLTDATSISNNVLQGNLYIVLSGDPTLTYEELYELFSSLQSKHITAIAGNVYIDNTAYDQRFYGPGWVWKDKDYCYAAPISASIINHNCLSFKVTPTVPGRAAQIVKSPNYFYPVIRNAIVTKTKRTRACYVRLSKGYGSSIGLDGCMPAGRYAWGVSYVVADVPEYNRALFKNVLTQQGVRVYGNITFGSASSGLRLIGNHDSKPLNELISEMLKKSDNIIAGALFKKLGQLYSRQPGSWENGSVAVSQILSRQAGVNITGMRVLDGSGLSPNNLATPSQMMQVLDFAYHHTPTSYEFVSALPIAGVDGTLKHRMLNIARKVRAKTGTISGVASLAGYTMSANKEPLAFVIMINGNKGMGWRYKETEDKIVTALTRYKRS